MIVKVQLPIASSGSSHLDKSPVLVYNEDRSVTKFLPLNSDICAMMGDSPKRFFEASVRLDEKGETIITLGMEQPDPGW